MKSILPVFCILIYVDIGFADGDATSSWHYRNDYIVT
jgi:hypothetical protein